MALEGIETPAMIYVPAELQATARAVRTAVTAAGAQLLYSVKAQSFVGILETICPHVSGFSASSLFEARLSREVLGHSGTVHLTQPGLPPAMMSAVARHCDYIAFNSVAQLDSFLSRRESSARPSLGVRVNAGLNFVSDERFAPCRAHSKLGVPLEQLGELVAATPSRLHEVEGIHLHHNCESRDLEEMYATVRRVLAHIAPLLRQLRWVNLGGGYLLPHAENTHRLVDTVTLVRKEAEAEVFIEPGTCMVESGVYLVSTVLDVVRNQGRQLAVLDTTINHMPDVFSYQHTPPVHGTSEDGAYEYILAGASCLAGDLFGTYRFDAPLRAGSRVVFLRFGDYTTVKASMFNGINFPSVYALSDAGEPVCRRRFEYEDFAEVFAGRQRAAPEAG